MTVLSDQRIGRITGSRVGAILGLDPDRSRSAVMREMVRQYYGAEEEFTGNPITQWGHDHEHLALTRYELERGVEVHSRQAFFRHPQFEFLGVTVDGLVGDDGLVEAKCPWRANYTSIDQRPHYLAQGALQAECTQRRWVDFGIWRPISMSIERKPYEPSWIERNFDKLVEFIGEFREIVSDPERAAPYLAPKLDIRTDGAWIELATEAQELLGDKEQIEARLAAIKSQMALMAGLSSAKGAGIHLVRVEKQGRIAFKKVLEKHLPDLDLDEYRGDPSVEWQLRRSKED